ncbi:hypothetical protein [Effusibacillus dendaii]|uniref:Uncharacterized protein n=1 Tax=Effusibacillus dendaii TaxID=2743772 RepID=A0A7I8D9A0_9BACL|nr:hypothetical protein [Effusibacillus dendaii]BCJ85090.1 hypothetical protein skT53_00750 [Effusibacillus dendaii]
MQKRKWILMMVASICLIVLFQTGLVWSNMQHEKLAAGPFSRAASLDSALSVVPQQLSDDEFVYLTDHAMVRMKLIEGRLQPVQKWSLPSPSLAAAKQLKVVGDAVYWIAEDSLFRSQREHEEWGPVHDLGKAFAFDVIVGADGAQYITVSDDRQIGIAVWQNNQIYRLRQIALQDVVWLHTRLEENGRLSIASIAESGSVDRALWWTTFNAVAVKLEGQTKIGSFQLPHGTDFRSIDFRLTDTDAYLFYTAGPVHTAGSGHTAGPVYRDETATQTGDRLFLLTFSFKQLQAVHWKEIKVLTESGTVSGGDHRSQPSADFSEWVALNGNIWRVDFKQGEPVRSEIAVGHQLSVGHPLLLTEPDSNHKTLVWLRRSTAKKAELLFCTDNPVEKQRIDQLTSKNWPAAVSAAGKRLGGVVFALAAVIKWAAAPLLYLGCLSVFRRRLKNARWGFLLSVCIALYMANKLLFIGQFYGPQSVLLMPEWAATLWGKYLSAFGTALAGSWAAYKAGGTGADFSSIVRYAVFFMLFDMIVSSVWFGFFIN